VGVAVPVTPAEPPGGLATAGVAVPAASPACGVLLPVPPLLPVAGLPSVTAATPGFFGAADAWAEPPAEVRPAPAVLPEVLLVAAPFGLAPGIPTVGFAAAVNGGGLLAGGGVALPLLLTGCARAWAGGGVRAGGAAPKLGILLVLALSEAAPVAVGALPARPALPGAPALLLTVLPSLPGAPVVRARLEGVLVFAGVVLMPLAFPAAFPCCWFTGGLSWELAAAPPADLPGVGSLLLPAVNGSLLLPAVGADLLADCLEAPALGIVLDLPVSVAAFELSMLSEAAEG
jgi:hypothetical protein